LETIKKRKLGKSIFLISFSIGMVGWLVFLIKIATITKEDPSSGLDVIGGIGLISAIVGFSISAFGAVLWEPKIRKKSDKIFAFGAFSPLISIVVILVLNVIFGSCFYPGCNTQLEITSITTPEIMRWDSVPNAEFGIKNIGYEKAENCQVVWDYPSYQTKASSYIESNYFSLNPQEETKIHLTGEAGVGVRNKYVYQDEPCTNTDYYDRWFEFHVRCNNADTGPMPRIPLLIECPDK
jgi:hypothetical protein